MTWISILKTEIFIRRKWQKHVRRIRYTETKTFTGHFLNSKEKEAHWFWLYIWLKRYSAEKFLEILREIVFPNYLTYTCVNDTYTDFIYRFVEAINFIAPSKKSEWRPTQNLGLITKLCQQYKDGINSIKKSNILV